jgi:hypothetical protein
VTLDTRIYVLDEVEIGSLFRHGQELMGKYDYDGGHRPPERQDFSDTSRDDVHRLANKIGQGLPGILEIRYREGAPLATAEQAATCTTDCDPGDDYHYHPHTCFAEIGIDTGYGYRDPEGRGCGDLHALLVAEIGNWLDKRDVRWEWRNEFTGEVHGGAERYHRLIDLCSAGFEAAAWFRSSVLPVINSIVNVRNVERGI